MLFYDLFELTNFRQRWAAEAPGAGAAGGSSSGGGAAGEAQQSGWEKAAEAEVQRLEAALGAPNAAFYR